MTSTLKSKPRLLLLNGSAGHNPWRELGVNAPNGFLLETLLLTQIHEWTASTEIDSTAALVLDLDDLGQTQPLDEWALSAWRNTFNELIVRCTNPDGRAPLLLAYTREPTWENAMLGVRVGARDMVKLSRLNERLHEIFQAQLGPLPIIDENSNVVALGGTRVQPKVDRPSATIIPKHAIPFPIEGLEGTSAAIEGVRNIVRKSAPLDTSVLIVGATGSGKELVARCIHRYSPRAQHNFVAVNCGAIAPGLVEAELFGHYAGAFTGALHDRVGYLAAANGGTLFLDEVSELPLEVQVKLLRALQERSITPIGSSKSQPIDIRVLAASQEDLDEKCAQAKFREDLLYRLRVMEINLPSLTERKSDIPEISKTILKKLARRHKRSVLKVSEDVMEKFLLYAWPGNVRELENALEHGATLAWAEAREVLLVKDLPESVQFASMSTGKEGELKEAVRRFEREYIAATVRRLGGAKEEAADVLGLSLATLYRKLGGGP